MAITHEKMRDLIVTVNYMIARCVSEPDGLSNEHYNNCSEIIDILHEAAKPTAQERKHGHWVRCYFADCPSKEVWHECSVCGESGFPTWKTCPYCDAIMNEAVAAE